MYTRFSSFVALLCAFGGEARCAICRETLICQSHQVYISSRSAKDCAETEKELNGLGPGQCISIPADMQKLEQVEHLVAELSKREKALHVLVNNAGAAWGETIDDYPVCCFFTSGPSLTRSACLPEYN